MVYSISDAVKEILDELTFLHSSMEYDLLNFSAVGRFIRPVVSSKVGFEAGLDAVSVAVRRHMETMAHKSIRFKLLEAVKETKLILRTDLSMLVVKNWQETNFLNVLTDIVPEVDFKAGEKMYLIVRSGELVILCNSRFSSSIEGKVNLPAKLIAKENNLAVITMNLQHLDFDVPGILQFFARQFEMTGINVLDVFSTRGKITFVFAQRDAAKAYERISAAIDAAGMMPFSMQKGSK